MKMTTPVFHTKYLKKTLMDKLKRNIIYQVRCSYGYKTGLMENKHKIYNFMDVI